MKVIRLEPYEVNDCIRLLEKMKKINDELLLKRKMNKNDYRYEQDKIDKLIQRFNGKYDYDLVRQKEGWTHYV